jgi:hypothetical protein
MEQDKKQPHFELTGSILNCCFEVRKRLQSNQEFIVDMETVETVEKALPF